MIQFNASREGQWTTPLSGIIALALMFAGCATAHVNWQARIGHYTYDQAVLDYGPPDKSATLKDGTVVADWLTSRGRTYGHTSLGLDYPWYPGPYYSGYYESSSPDHFLRLTFGPDGQLNQWKTFFR